MIKPTETLLSKQTDDDHQARPNEASGPTRRRARLDRVLFALSATGVPIGIFALWRLGRLGGLLLEVAAAALCTRAVAMVTAGTAPRLRVIPRLLLFAETAADALATIAGFWAWVWQPFVRPALMKQAGARARRRRWGRRRLPAKGIGVAWVTPVAVATWMAAMVLHVARMAIYISPGRGLQKDAAAGS